MKKSWSSKWNGSRQPRKQRKYRYNAPLHIRHKFLSSHLSKELRERFGKRSVPIRKGDEVLIMAGSFKGIRGSVERVNLKESRIYVEGVKRKKIDGSEISVSIHPSNVMITKLTLEDKARQSVFERSRPKETKPQKEKVAKAEIVEKKPKPEEGHVKKPEHNHAQKIAKHPHGKPHGEEKDW